jgi:hypothetical protein
LPELSEHRLLQRPYVKHHSRELWSRGHDSLTVLFDTGRSMTGFLLGGI